MSQMYSNCNYNDTLYYNNFINLRKDALHFNAKDHNNWKRKHGVAL